MNITLNKFSEKFNIALMETNFDSIYETIDILSDIPESECFEKTIFNKIEKKLLIKNKLIKLNGEDKSYYCKKDNIYDEEGIVITDNYIDYLEDENIFCEYKGDDIYKYMKMLLLKRIKKIEPFIDNYEEISDDELYS